MPNPPICISIKTIIFPHSVKAVDMSIVASPVTQVADADVNKASIQTTGFACENGSINNNAPINIVDKKPKTNT